MSLDFLEPCKIGADVQLGALQDHVDGDGLELRFFEPAPPAREARQALEARAALLLDVRRPEQIAPAFDQAVRQGAHGIIVGVETLTQSNRAQIVELAAKHRLPAIYSALEFVEAGGLMSYGVFYPDLYYRAAGFVDRIFKGASPGELPIERPSKFALYINRRTAHVLELTVPPDLLLRSERMID